MNLLAASAVGFAWWFPGTWTSFGLTWLGGILLVNIARRERPLRNLYLCGCIVQIIGFYWMVELIDRFGDFTLWQSIAIFSLFVVASSAQFLFFGLFYKHLPQQLDWLAIRAPLAWVIFELVTIRIFPWHIGHTLISLPELTQISDVTGSLGLSFLVLWTADSLNLIHRYRSGAVALGLAFSFVLLYGANKIDLYNEKALSRREIQPVAVSLVQGNTSLLRESDEEVPDRDLAHYKKLSENLDREGELIIWPESAILHWVPTKLKRQQQAPRLPKFEHATLLTGSLMWESREKLYNSAFTIAPDGTIGSPYHKRVLMPYGEYTPFSDLFPWLLEINNMAGNFTAGHDPEVHTIDLTNRESPIHAATLICYEDVVQELAAEAVRDGAELLVNLTNDAWFGDSPALHQHHLIASFRAIENKRYHLRATNTGKTAIISPLGETVSSIPTATPGVLSGKAYPISDKTLFSRFGNTPWWSLSLLTSGLVLLNMIFGRPRQRAVDS